MKSVAVFPGSQKVEVIERERPRLSQPDEVTLRVLEIGICGTDREICAFEYGTAPREDDHLVIGYECLAEVVEVGSGVDRLHVGDLVVPTVRRPCIHHECVACRCGRQDFCYTVQRRPPWIDRDTPNALQGRGLSALVLGAGPVGLLGGMALVAAGFTTYVYSCEVPPDPGIDLAATIGAPACLMRDMVLKNQVLLGTVNVGPEAFASALLSLSVFSRRWPAAMPTLIADHYQPEQAPDLLLGRPTGIKSVIAFDNALT